MYIFLTVLSLFTSISQAQPDAKTYKLYKTELDYLFETLDNRYAPLALKKETIKLDWENTKPQIYKFLPELQSSLGFYFTYANMLNSLNDAHVSVDLPSSLEHSLPIEFGRAGKGLYVSYIDRSEMPASCPVKLGDELIGFNGMKPSEVQTTSFAFNKNGNTLTNYSFFAKNLSKLKESKGIPLSLEPFRKFFEKAYITLHSPGAAKAYICEVPYKIEGVGLIGKNFVEPKDPKSNSQQKAAPSKHPPQSSPKLMMASMGNPGIDEWINTEAFDLIQSYIEKYNLLFNMASGVETFASSEPSQHGYGSGKKFELGAAEPFFELPSNFKRIQSSFIKGKLVDDGTGFFAGTFERGGKNIGFLRIPSYAPKNIMMSLFGIRYYISQLQKKSDLLIIDQTNNPGGAVVFSDFLIKSLTGKYNDAKHMRFTVKPSQSFMRTYIELLNSMVKNVKDASEGKGPILFSQNQYEYLAKRLYENGEKVWNAWNEEKSLSEPVSLVPISEFLEMAFDASISQGPGSSILKVLFGSELFTKQTYTKPIYFMINEFDFSGGDYTPANLQDYGRAKLVGMRTAGAGGTVEEFSSNLLEIKFRLTTSLMLRSNGKFVENYGVQPDIAFDLSRNDFVTGYKTVFPRLLQTLKL